MAPTRAAGYSSAAWFAEYHSWRPIERMFFVVLLPNGMVVEPKVAERL
jgi:hypothetical protein